MIDVVPPYHVFEGALREKLRDCRGRTLIRCGPDLVEVDSFTYDTLKVGERLRLRYTRRKRVVSIDRLVPPSDLDNAAE